MYHLILFNLIFSLFIKYSYQVNYQGMATVYGGKIYGGSCGFKSLWTNKNMQFNYGVAINSKQYNNSLSCGSCVNIKYKDRNVNAVVTDICPECEFGDLDLFTETYQTVINEEFGKKSISWNFIDCPNEIVTNSIQLRIDEINYYWLSIQPENFKCSIASISILQNNYWIEMTRQDSIMTGLYFIYNKQLNLPFKLKITNIYNEEIITPDYYELKNLFILDKQFNCNSHYNFNHEISVSQNNNQINFDCN